MPPVKQKTAVDYLVESARHSGEVRGRWLQMFQDVGMVVFITLALTCLSHCRGEGEPASAPAALEQGGDL